ncbi:MAG: hypothetical protein EA403_15930, partial [Spirochaetaceae bacterium]
MVKLIPALIAVTLLVGACATVPETTSDAASREASESMSVANDALIAPAVAGVPHVMRLPELNPRPERTLPQVTPPGIGERIATTLISFPPLSEHEPVPATAPTSAAASDPTGTIAPPGIVSESGGLHEPAVPPGPTVQPPAQPRAAQPAAEPRHAAPAAAGPRPASSLPEGLPPRVAPTASAITPPPAASEAPAPIDRTVTTTVGEETVVRLDGENWLFLGSTPEGVVYRRRRLLDGATEVVLR